MLWSDVMLDVKTFSYALVSMKEEKSGERWKKKKDGEGEAMSWRIESSAVPHVNREGST